MNMILTNDKVTQRLVTTVSGREVPRDRTKRINGNYYEMHVECVHLPPIGEEKANTSWYRLDHPSIGYNYETSSYDKIPRMRAAGLIEGFIDKDKRGYFKQDLIKNALLFSDINSTIPYYALTRELAESIGYIEELSTGKYFDKNNLSAKHIEFIKTKRRVDYKELSLNYHANESNGSYLKILDMYNKTIDSIEPNDNAVKIADMMQGLSFGIEFETSTGTIPSNMLGSLGLVPLRDGSVSGFEYTTVPLSGAKGLTVLKNSCTELSKRCDINLNCSLHIHIGNIPRERKYALAFLKLGYLIQDDVFSIVPSYKSDPRNRVPELAGKEKDYCKKLPKFKYFKNTIDTTDKDSVYQNFQEVFRFLCQRNANGDVQLGEEEGKYTFDSRRHPIEAKWNQYGRYYWLSVFPYVFSNSGTVEMRLHQPTLNFHKTVNWLLINSAIVNYVIFNVDKILEKDFKVTLDQIVNSYKTLFDQKDNESQVSDPFVTTVTDYLMAYMKNRKTKYSIDEKKGLYVDREEIKDDSNYKFENKGISDLY